MALWETENRLEQVSADEIETISTIQEIHGTFQSRY